MSVIILVDSRVDCPCVVHKSCMDCPCVVSLAWIVYVWLVLCRVNATRDATSRLVEIFISTRNSACTTHGHACNCEVINERYCAYIVTLLLFICILIPVY